MKDASGGVLIVVRPFASQREIRNIRAVAREVILRYCLARALVISGFSPLIWLRPALQMVSASWLPRTDGGNHELYRVVQCPCSDPMGARETAGDRTCVAGRYLYGREFHRLHVDDDSCIGARPGQHRTDLLPSGDPGTRRRLRRSLGRKSLSVAVCRPHPCACRRCIDDADIDATSVFRDLGTAGSNCGRISHARNEPGLPSMGTLRRTRCAAPGGPNDLRRRRRWHWQWHCRAGTPAATGAGSCDGGGHRFV